MNHYSCSGTEFQGQSKGDERWRRRSGRKGRRGGSPVPGRASLAREDERRGWGVEREKHPSDGPPHAGCHPGFGKAEDREPVTPNGSVQAVELPPDRRWRLASRHHPTRRILDACLRRRDTRERGERLPPHAGRGRQWITGRGCALPGMTSEGDVAASRPLCRQPRTSIARSGAYWLPERRRAATLRIISHSVDYTALPSLSVPSRARSDVAARRRHQS